MLEEYKELEPIVYKEMYNCINRSLSHAYLFNTNDNVYSEKMIMAFIKSIVCKLHKNQNDYLNCNICKNIDNNNHPDIKKIFPDGLMIKKEQLDDLQEKFSTKSLENNKRIYIIYGADKLNTSAANSLLKFLEEPSEGIIAILITNNINQVINTIISRCQIMTFSKNKVEDYINYNNIIKDISLNKLLFSIYKINDKSLITEEHINFVNNAIKFINYYEQNGVKTIVQINEMFNDKFKKKEEIVNFFECLIFFYSDVLNYKLNRNILFYDDYINLVEKTSNKYNFNQIIKKLEIIINKERMIKYNLNIEMLVDSMLIDMEV